jgi:hypothetical protein
MASHYDLFLTELASRLKPLGLKRTRRRFFVKPLPYGEAFLRFQKSITSTAAVARFTAELIIVHTGIRKRAEDLDFNYVVMEQYNRRITEFRRGSAHWWEIRSAADIAPSADDIESVIRDWVMPEIDRYSSEQALVEIWEDGCMIGLTEWQWAVCLALYYALNAMSARCEEFRKRIEKSWKPDSYERFISIYGELFDDASTGPAA